MRPRCFVFLLLSLLLGMQAAAQDEGKEIFRQAESRFSEGRFELALERYDELLRSYPYSEFASDAQFRRAVIFFRLERFRDSYDLLLRIERRYKSTSYFAQVPLWKGLALHELGEHRQAVAEFTTFLASSPGGEEAEQALLHRALSERALGFRDEAVASLTTLLDRPARSPGYPLVILSSLLMEKKDHARVLKLAEIQPPESLEPPWRDRFLLFLAEASAASGRTEEAARLFGRLEASEREIAGRAFLGILDLNLRTGKAGSVSALIARAEERLGPSSDAVFDLRIRAGIGLYREGREEEAFVLLRLAWDRRGSRRPPAEAALALAELDRSAGRGANAEQVLSDFLSSGGRNGLVLLRLGEIGIELGKFREAESRLDEFLRSEEAKGSAAELVPRATYARAYALYRLGRYAEALAEAGAGKAGDPESLLLQAKLLALLERRREAIGKFDDYLARRPGDVAAAAETVKLLFASGDYAAVKERAGRLLGDSRTDAATKETLSYLRGMAGLNLKEYRDASRDLASVKVSAELLPYAIFYSAWAFFRLGEYGEALSRFRWSLNDGRVPLLSSQAGYYAAWCAFSLGRYDEAAGFLVSYRSGGSDRALAARAVFLLAKTFQALGRIPEAREEYRRVFVSFSGTGQEDEARFEYAGLAAKSGEYGLAEREYAEFIASYPTSPLREAAFFKRGEVLFSAKRWEDAERAFSDYRTNFPGGGFTDASLYWGGLAASERGEKFGALLLWEKLADSYRGSPFRADALRRSADVYASSGEFSKALGRYQELQNLYPQDAAAFGVKRKMDEITYMKEGFSVREAELTARITSAGGSSTAAGRTALLELARFHIYEGRDADRAEPFLAEVKNREPDDPAAAAEARFLQGELKRRKQDFSGAAAMYLEAATASGAGKDLVGRSLLRGVETMLLAGRRDEAEKLVGLLEKNFPASDWSREGEKLLGGRK